MNKRFGAVQSVIFIVVFGLISKIFGFAREILLGAKFGSGQMTDAYFVALSSIALFSGLLTASISRTAIPILSEVEKKEGKEGKARHTNNLLNIVMVLSSILISSAFFAAPLVIKIMAPGFVEAEQFNLAVLLMRVGLPTIVVSSVTGVMSAFLHTEGSFIESSLTGFPTNFLYIIFLAFLADKGGIVGLMVTSVLASLINVLIYANGLRKFDYKYTLFLDIKDEYVNKILKLVPPVLLSVGISELNSIIDKAMASNLVDGSISALNYATTLNSNLTGLFVSAITIVLYPTLAKEATKESYDDFKRVLLKGINVIVIITVPAMIGLTVLGQPIVKAVFQRGKFDELATLMTTGALYFTVIGMTTSALNNLFNNAFFSVQDTKTPVFIGFIAVLTNVAFNFILIGPMAHRGLALATSISSIIGAILYIYLLRKKIGQLGFTKALNCGLKTLFASIIMGTLAFFAHGILASALGPGNIKELLALGSSVGLGVLVYFTIIYLLKVDEFIWIMDLALVKVGIKKK